MSRSRSRGAPLRRYAGYQSRMRLGLAPVAGATRRVGFYGRFGTTRQNIGGRAPELKFLDTALSFTADTTFEVPATGQLSLIPQGATESQRVGRKCVIKTIQVKLRAVMAAGAVAFDDVDIWVMQDTQCNGAAAAVLDVFLQNTNCAIALRNLTNSERFRVLKHFRMRVQADAGVAAAFSGDQSFAECFIKCNIPMEFNGATGAITEIKSNNIFLIAGSVNTDDQITIQGNARVKYTDV